MNEKKHKQPGLLPYFIAAGLTTVGAAPAGAQTPPPVSNSTRDDGSTTLEEVVVTSFKQGAQSVQDVPSSTSKC